MLRNKHEGRLDGGAAAVEMALVLPLLLLVLFGIIDFGRGFNAQMQVTQAAREAVRVKALGQDDTAARARVTAATGGLGTPVPTTAFGTVAGTVATCVAGDTTSNVSATVSYSFKFVTPLGPVAGLIGATTLPGPGVGTVKTLSSDGVMRCAG
jgi:Flp pilus assembly protein TadG